MPRQALRAAFIDPAETNAYRLVHGAPDGWPGWRVDRLGEIPAVTVGDGTDRRAGEASRIVRRAGPLSQAPEPPGAPARPGRGLAGARRRRAPRRSASSSARTACCTSSASARATPSACSSISATIAAASLRTTSPRASGSSRRRDGADAAECLLIHLRVFRLRGTRRRARHEPRSLEEVSRLGKAQLRAERHRRGRPRLHLRRRLRLAAPARAQGAGVRRRRARSPDVLAVEGAWALPGGTRLRAAGDGGAAAASAGRRAAGVREHGAPRRRGVPGDDPRRRSTRRDAT